MPASSWLALNPILPSRPEQSMANPPASARGDVSFSEYMKSTSPRRPTRHLGSLAMSQTSKGCDLRRSRHDRSEEHTSELQSLMRISSAVFCLKKKKTKQINKT